jgi:hypothetical protein
MPRWGILNDAMPQSLSAVYIHLIFSTKWQGGYADFSVSQSNLEQVKQYIAGQEDHHRKIGFQDELRALLRKHEIAWDEKYVWD